MKKTIISIFICAILLATCALSACTTHNTDVGNASENAQHSGLNDNTSNQNDNASSTSSTIYVDQQLHLGPSEMKQVKSVSSPVLKSSYQDGEFYYYLFYLGQITNVPLDQSGSFLIEWDPSKKLDVSIKTKTSKLSSDQIATTSSNTVKEAVSLSGTLSSKLSVKAGTKNNNVAAEYAASISESMSSSQSFSESYSRAAHFSEENAIERTVVFSENSPKGMYGYCTTAVLDMYAFVVKDPVNDEYSVKMYSEISKNWMGFYYFSTKEEFLDYKCESIAFDMPSNLPIPDYNGTAPDHWNAISVTMTRYNCNNGDGYNKSKPESSAVWRSRHDGFELGELVIYGCKQVGDYYKVVNKNDFSIKWKVKQDVEDLPRVGADKTEIAFDDCKTIYGTDFNEKINEGAYWLRVTYSDDTQKTFKRANIMENAMPGTIVELCNSTGLDANKTIKNIECIIVYELYCDPTGFMSQDEWTDWRLEYTYNFINN